MATPILATKLYNPPPRPGLVPRPRLIERLNEGCAQGCRLTLISASAGFGKTTLLGEWIGHLGKPVAWLSLEKADNDPGRFWTYILAALRTIQPDLGDDIIEMRFTSPQVHADAVLTTLINEIAALPDPLVLILDDFHVIDSSSIQEGMVFLLEHLPAQLHLVIASRTDPAWPLAHWRTRGQLVEIRATDLRFTPEEAAEYLKRTMKLDLSIQEIAALEGRTEGWIAGLQMAALSLQGREDVREFIDAFAGSNRYIFDYLIEEVFGRQPAEVKDFLLRTSILARLSAPLCDAVLERTDSQDLLLRLETANLFLVPLDDERQWYRYHHLFADLLGRRLEQMEHDHIAELHRRASEWYAANNLPAEAIHHALEARDFLLVNQYTSANVLGVVEQTELLDMLRHFEELPDQQIVENPWLGVPYSLVKAFVNPSGDVERILQKSEQGLVNLENTSFKQRLISLLDGIRAYLAYLKGEPDRVLRFVHRAMDNLPQDEQTILAQFLNLEGLAYQLQLKPPDAIRSYEAALLAGQSMAGLFQAMVNCGLVSAQFSQGQLRQTFSNCQRILSLANESDPGSKDLPFYNHLYATMSLVQLEWNNLELAIRFARESVAMSEQWHQAETWQYTLSCLSRALCAAGNLEEAFAINQRAMQLAYHVSPYYYRFSATDEIWLNLAKGDISKAVQRRTEIEPDMNDYEKRGMFLLGKASLLYAQGLYAEILSVLEEPMRALERGCAYWYLINLMPIQALALKALGREEDALTILGHCLTLAKPEGYVRAFVEKGLPMVELLKVAMGKGIETEYIKSLLPAFHTPSESRDSKLPLWCEPIPPKGPGLGIREIQLPAKELAEPISERELEILRLLESSMNTPEIARELYISVGTVRTHIKNIYRKLDVNRRMEAVQRARELGLI